MPERSWKRWSQVPGINTQSWLYFEQEVGLELSWDPFQAELPCNPHITASIFVQKMITIPLMKYQMAVIWMSWIRLESLGMMFLPFRVIKGDSNLCSDVSRSLWRESNWWKLWNWRIQENQWLLPLLAPSRIGISSFDDMVSQFRF